uniref:CSON007674 protein n=1 Tax=Culicoides sonorensis TaxID=179676 RepID=A0A336M0K4_CULSO
MSESFSLTASVQVNEEIVVDWYRSNDTGLTVILARMKGPVLHAYFVVPTEPTDNSGTPHALEHLIFGGSDNYPYKGVLDIMANRYLSYGCEANTKKDHTCYMLDIACNQGLNKLLPVYLDHILFPLLTNYCFTTEIYHINGEAKEGGVVHTELLAKEYDCNALVMLEIYRKLYPDTGYAFDAHGLANDLRSESNVDIIREYHSKYYRPNNLTVFISGMVSPEEIFTALGPIETKIKEKGDVEPFENKWNTDISPLEETVIEQIEYPSDEETAGSVFIAWRGPNSITEHETFVACTILLKYLCCGTISPIQRNMLEIDDPFATHISVEFYEHAQAMFIIKLSGVKVEKIDEIDSKFMEILSGIADQGSDEEIDMKRMEILIQSEFTDELNNLERQPYLTVFQKILPTMIYAQEDVNEDLLKERFFYDGLTVEMLAKTKDDWMELLQKYFIDGKHVTIQAVPSLEKLQQLTEEEQNRLETLKSELDEENLASKQAELEEAIAKNEENPPEELITAAELLASAEIKFLWSLRYCSSRGTNPPGINLQKMPVYTEAYDLSTNFIYLTVTFNTDCVPTELRLYLPLFIDLIINSPIEIDDELMSVQDMTALREKDLISLSAYIGILDEGTYSFLPYSNHLQFSIQVEMEDYEIGITWLHNILYKTKFISERIKICATKLMNTMIEMKRDEHMVSRQLLDAMFYDPTSNIRLHSVLKQRQFLTEVLGKIEEGDEVGGVIEQLNFLRDIVMNPNNNIAVHIATDWSKLATLEKELVEPWYDLFPGIDLDEVPKKLHVLPDFVFFDLLPLEDNSNGVIVGRRSAKSTYLYQAVRAINDFRDLDLPALIVFLQYLTQPEGAIWRSLRGRGLAYDYSMNIYPNEGLLKLSICQSNDIVAAYRVMKGIIEAQLQENVEWNESLVESAKSTSIYNAVNTEGTIAQLVMRSLIVGFQEVPYDWNKVFIKKLQKVTIESLNEVGQKYLTKLFTEDARISCVCPIDKKEEIQEGIAELGVHLQIEPSLNESILAKF